MEQLAPLSVRVPALLHRLPTIAPPLNTSAHPIMDSRGSNHGFSVVEVGSSTNRVDAEGRWHETTTVMWHLLEPNQHGLQR